MISKVRAGRAVWRRYRALAAELPHDPTPGVRAALRLAALGIAIHDDRRASGASSVEATAAARDLWWRAYEGPMGWVWTAVVLMRRRPRDRLELAVAAARRIAFGPPSFHTVERPSEPDVVAFDVLRCPFAEYFQSVDCAALCEAAFCDLDFPMARKLGATLERSGTLAGGAPCCDFRWRVGPRGSSDDTTARFTADPSTRG